MHTITPPLSGFSTTASARRTTSIAIVDSAEGGFDDCIAAAEAAGAQLQIVRSAAEALRLANSTPIDLWFVNAELPGLSGFELCGMLRSRSNRPQVHLVADEYSVATEQAAWRSRATLFACKAPHIQWLQQWLLDQSKPATAQQAAECQAA